MFMLAVASGDGDFNWMSTADYVYLKTNSSKQDGKFCFCLHNETKIKTKNNMLY